MNTSLRFSLVSALGILLQVTAIAQQDPAYSLFMYGASTINPALAGSNGTLSATALVRQQWTGVEGAPQTQTFTVDALLRSRKVPAPMGRKVGLGLTVVNDQLGITKNLNVNGQYAYHMQLNQASLSMGLQAGFNNYRADYTSVITNQQNSPDNSFGDNTSRMIFNFGAGAYFTAEKFYVGFSVPHVINQKLDGVTATSATESRQFRHYYLTAGYVHDAGLKFKVKPALMIKVAEGAPVQLDLSATVWYQEHLGVGISYRTNDSVTGLLQIQLGKQFRLGYAYDFIVTSMSRYTSGNNELMLRYQLQRKKSNNSAMAHRPGYY